MTGTAAAQSPPAEPGERLREELDRSLDRLLVVLRALLAAVPHYALPEVNENGDIIIRRLNPPPPQRPSPPLPQGQDERT